jgi:NTE family protein
MSGEGTRALVLAGGGVTGIAWEIGVLDGLAAAGTELRSADLIVGTSAGATVGAQVAGPTPFEDLVARQLTPPGESGEIGVTLDVDAYRAKLAEILSDEADPDTLRARIGAMALEADTVPEAVRRQVIVARLPVAAWPVRRLVLTAVDTATGELRTFSSADDVDLIDAVAASCAVPGIWPPVTIGSRRYMDGGARSLTNADVAVGHDRVLFLVPMAMLDEQVAQLDGELASLGAGVRTLVVAADEASVAAMGPNPLDPAFRASALAGGRRQAAELQVAVKDFWG